MANSALANAPLPQSPASVAQSFDTMTTSARTGSSLAIKQINGVASETAASSDAFVDTIGINTHLWWGAYGGNFNAVQNALTSLGVRHIRDGMVWVSWGKTYYDQLNSLASKGIHTTLTTALGEDPAKIANYRQFIPNSLEAIEAPNEPNVNAAGTSWVAPIRTFQKALYAAVRANPANAQVSVLSSAVAYNDDAYRALGDLSAYLDAGNVHDYFGGNAPDSAWIAARMAGASAVSANKKIVATETGYCTSTASQGVSDAVMAKYVPRAFFEQFNAGVTRTLEYALLDDGTNPSDYWNQCGLMRYDFSPKPAYTALQKLIALLSDTTAPTPRTSLAYTLLGNTGSVHHTLLQKNDGSLYLAMWLNSSVFDQARRMPITVAPQPIAVSFGSSVSSLQAYTYDALGNLTPQTIPISQNTAQVTVTDSVTIFKIVPGSGGGRANVAPVVLNPAAHWSFDEGSGTNAADSVNAAGNATAVGSASWTAALFGSGIGLAPSNHWSAPAGLIDTSQSYSVSAWLMLADTTAAHTAIALEGGQVAASTLAYRPGNGFAFTLNGKDTTWQGTSIRAAQTGVTPTIGKWYNVTATVDTAKCQISLYVDGALAQTTPGCASFRATGVTDFGYGQWQTWSGALDEVNLYARALTPQEIATLAGAQSIPTGNGGAANGAPVILNPAAHWSFDEGSGNSASDSVNAAGNAKVIGSASWRAAMFGSGVGLAPATHWYASAGLIDTSQSYSVSAWLNVADTTSAHTAISVEGSQVPAFTLAYVPGTGFAFTLNGKDTTWRGSAIRAAQSGVTPAIGTWYNVTATLDTAKCQISLYVNGTLAQSTPGCATFRATGVTSFGYGQWQTWSGALDEVNLYARALTPQEIATLARH